MSTSNAPDEPKGGKIPASTTFLSPNSVFAESHPGQGRRAVGATAGSIVFHGLLIGLILFLLAKSTTETVVEPPRPVTTLVYLNDPGPGGGGGGSPAPAPPKPVEIPRTPPPKPVPLTPPTPVPVPPPPPPALTAPVMTPDAKNFQAAGSSSVSLAAYGGGGRGTGIGEGAGSGVGRGTGGGFGGGAYRPGAGITNPVPLQRPTPTYTSQAMVAKIQGTVVLEARIEADGSVGDVRVVRSLDRTYGLDNEAMKAARRWVFRPATDRDGKPVPILVLLELEFTIH